MHKGHPWRSHPRRDLKYFGAPLDYWPDRQHQQSSFGPIYGVDPTEFDFLVSDPGIEAPDGLGLSWQWIMPFDVVLFFLEMDWTFPSGPTSEEGQFLLHWIEIINGFEMYWLADVKDTIVHDGDFRHFLFTDLNTTVITISGPDMETPFGYDFWPSSYAFEPP